MDICKVEFIWRGVEVFGQVGLLFQCYMNGFQIEFFVCYIQVYINDELYYIFQEMIGSNVEDYVMGFLVYDLFGLVQVVVYCFYIGI